MDRILIAEPDAAAAERLVQASGARNHPLVSPSLDEAFDQVREDPPLVLIIGPSLLVDVAFELAEHVSSSCDTTVVMAVPQIDAELLRRAMRSGVADVVSMGDSLAEITASVERATALALRRRGSGTGGCDKELGKVLTVFSTKGGVGKTVLATNLSVVLAKETGKRVALVDLDLEFGDVAIMLGMRPEHTIFDAVQVFDRLDGEMLAGFMETHDSGVVALLAPVRPEDAEGISAARVGQVIDLIRENYDYVVIDTCPSFSEAVLAALDRSDELYVVTMMDVASIKNSRISVQKLKQLGFDNGRLRLVLNRSDSKVLLQPAEVEKAMGGAICAHIPSDRTVPRSVNKGVPIVIDNPKTEVSRSILALARSAAAPVTKEVHDVA